jgi:hypothetical protein
MLRRSPYGLPPSGKARPSRYTKTVRGRPNPLNGLQDCEGTWYESRRDSRA